MPKPAMEPLVENSEEGMSTNISGRYGAVARDTEPWNTRPGYGGDGDKSSNRSTNARKTEYSHGNAVCQEPFPHICGPLQSDTSGPSSSASNFVY